MIYGRYFLCFAITLGLSSSSVRADEPAFAKFVDDYFDAYFTWKPSDGTAAGLHQYDNLLEDNSKEAFLKRIETVKAFQARLVKLRTGIRRDHRCGHAGKPDEGGVAGPRLDRLLEAKSDGLYLKPRQFDRWTDEAQFRAAGGKIEIGRRPLESRTGDLCGHESQRRKSTARIHRFSSSHGRRIGRLLQR